MKITTLRTILIIAAGMFVGPLMTAAQEPKAGPLYVSADCMKSANLDQDLEAMYEMLKLRENVNSETWVLVAATE